MAKGRPSTTTTLRGHTSRVTSVAFSPDGKRIVSGSYDNTVKVWDAEKGTEILSLKGHTLGVTGAAFSPDGKRIVSGSLDQTVKVWLLEEIEGRKRAAEGKKMKLQCHCLDAVWTPEHVKETIGFVPHGRQHGSKGSAQDPTIIGHYRQTRMPPRSETVMIVNANAESGFNPHLYQSIICRVSAGPTVSCLSR